MIYLIANINVGTSGGLGEEESDKNLCYGSQGSSQTYVLTRARKINIS